MRYHEVETVEDGNLFTTRMYVYDGWIYRMYDKSNQILSAVFVPDMNHYSQ